MQDMASGLSMWLCYFIAPQIDMFNFWTGSLMILIVEMLKPTWWHRWIQSGLMGMGQLYFTLPVGKFVSYQVS